MTCIGRSEVYSDIITILIQFTWLSVVIWLKATALAKNCSVCDRPVTLFSKIRPMTSGSIQAESDLLCLTGCLGVVGGSEGEEVTNDSSVAFRLSRSCPEVISSCSCLAASVTTSGMTDLTCSWLVAL